MGKLLTVERLKEVLHYASDTGIFTSLVSRGRTPVGALAGTVKPRGYVCIAVDGRLYAGHRLAVFYMTGKWPESGVDHINGDTGDNRWTNLREAAQAENCRNQRKKRTNTSGFKGVSRGKGRWVAHITVHYKHIYLGAFSTPELAHAAYCRAAEQHFGEFARSA